MFLTFRHRFESAHRFLNASSPKCQTPHGHTWWIELSVGSTQEQLNGHHMLIEFAQVKSHWRKFIDEVCDHSFFHHYEDEWAKSLLFSLPNARLLPFPGDPTTELIACLFFSKMTCLLSEVNSSHHVSENSLSQSLPGSTSQGLFVQSIRIEETPTNSVTVTHDSKLLWQTLAEVKHAYSGWWTNTSTADRSFKPNAASTAKNV